MRSSGVEMGELSLFSLIPLPKSKSQILTGHIWEKEQILTKGQQQLYQHISWPLNMFRHKYLCSKLTLCALSQRMFSGFRSLCAIPKNKQMPDISIFNLKTVSSNTACHFVQMILPLLWRKSRALAMSCTTRQASCSLKCCLLWMCSKIDPRREMRVH